MAAISKTLEFSYERPHRRTAMAAMSPQVRAEPDHLLSLWERAGVREAKHR